MFHDRAHHFHLRHLAAGAGLTRLYWSYGICGLAVALVSILGPIYLYRLGYSIQWILWFFIVTALIKTPFLPLAYKLMAKFGTQRVMGLGILFLVASYLSFGTIATFHWPLIILALLKALANGLYYSAFRASFSYNCNKSLAGRQVTRLNSLMNVLSILAPMIGGVVAAVLGVSAIYLIAAGMFVVAFLVLMMGGWSEPPPRFDLRRIPGGGALRDYWSNGFYSFSGVADLLVWPILISIIVPGYAGIGALGSALVLISVVLSLWVGKVEDKRGERVFTLAGSILTTIYSAARVLATSVVHLVGLGVVSSLGGALLSSSYESRYYKNVDLKNGLEYLFAMEIANSLSWLIYFPILLVVSYFVSFTDLLYVGVILVAPTVLGVMLIRPHQPMQVGE